MAMVHRTALVLSLLAATACSTVPAEGVARGQVLYKNCVPCHGDAAQGNQLVAAPQIAGLPTWYIERQVGNFQTGMRGAHPDDAPGLKMRPMSRMIKNEADLAAVAEYVSSLPPAKHELTLGGDATKGQGTYAVCTACHGADAAGNEAQNAPPLHNLQDWYIVAQISNFKAGHRAYSPKDTVGAQMKAMANTVTDDAAARDVAAYIHSLGGGTR